MTLARKPPTEPSVQEAVERHHTGALHVEAARIAYTSEIDRASARPGGRTTSRHVTGGGLGCGYRDHNRHEFVSTQGPGRWPANLVLAHFPGCHTGSAKLCVEGCPVRALGATGRYYYHLWPLP